MNTKTKYPYQNALDGLSISDPVQAFYSWCIERESIRKKRKAGDSFPWTSDPVFQKGRFLNVFREDDKGTKAVLRFADKTETQSDLIHALFFARWCNRDTTLNALEPAILKSPSVLRKSLAEEVQVPWQSDVYPVVPAKWDGRVFNRMEACIEMFPKSIGFIENCILKSGGSVVIANSKINAQLKMTNDFPIFMALVDLALFRSDLISPDSPVPTGIGAEPYLNILQQHLHCSNHQEVADKMIEFQSVYWPESKRKFTPIDIEYLSCECRKYYSYINGTKKLEGKNLFCQPAL